MSSTVFVSGLIFILATASAFPQRQLGSRQQKQDISKYFTNRQLDVYVPSGFGVNNNPPDNFDIIDSLWRSNRPPEGFYKGYLKVSGASRKGATITVSSYNTKYSGSFQVFY